MKKGYSKGNVQYKRNIPPELVKKLDEYLKQLKNENIRITKRD